jgi:hypothetical protein
MMHKLFFALICYISIAILFVPSARAQNSSTEGRDFYVTFTANTSTNACQIRYVVMTTCRITAQYGDGTYLDNDVLYTPGVYTKGVDVNKCRLGSGEQGGYNKMLHITSTQNIGVYALNMAANTTDATTVLPVATWGTDYTVISNGGIYETFLTIIAPTSGTTLTIKDKAGDTKLANYVLTTPVYNYVVPASAQTDVTTGYTIESNHPVAVFSSRTSGAMVTIGGFDHNYEQLYPTATAGKTFFLWNLSIPSTMLPTPTNTKDKVVVLALEGGTAVTKKVGNNTSTITLTNPHDTAWFWLDTAVHVNNSAAPVMLTSNKPIIVNHLLGFAPSIKWWSSTEQLITHAVVAPFIPTVTSVITVHKLDIMIPNGAQQNMIIREIRDGQTTTPSLTFHTNTSNPNYVIASRLYETYDEVMIELINPAGFIAYMTGYGTAESYIYSAGSGAFNLQNYFTITTHTQPYNDTYYLGTDEATHTFPYTGNITVKRTLERPFGSVAWYVNEALYYTESATGINHTQTIPASQLGCGKNAITMRVRYNDATVDSLYTGYVWRYAAQASDIEASGAMEVCAGSATTLTAGSSTVTNPVFKWYNTATAETAFYTGPSYTTPALSNSTEFYVSVLSGDGTVCENKPGERKKISITVAPCVMYVPVNPHLRSRVVNQ